MATVIQAGIIKLPGFISWQSKEYFYYINSSYLNTCSIDGSVTNRDIDEKPNWFLLSAGCLVLWSKDK